MRASRLISILLLLQNRRSMTAKELAHELEVSVRTVYRDMEALSEAGVPVYGEGGHDGGYRLVNGYRTRLTGMSTCEAEALLLDTLSSPATALGLGKHAEAARLKLVASLPPDLASHALQISRRFLFDGSTWERGGGGGGGGGGSGSGDTTAGEHVEALTTAVKNQAVVSMRLRRVDEPLRCSALGLVLARGRWYAVVACDAVPRTIPLVDVIGVTADDGHGGPFQAPEGFLLEEYWGNSGGR